MIILQVLHEFFPSYYGGTETHTAEISGELAKKDMRQRIYSL